MRRRQNMFCEKCGKEIKEDSSFCPHCGAKVKSESDKQFPRHFRKQYKKVLGLVVVGVVVAGLVIFGKMAIQKSRDSQKVEEKKSKAVEQVENVEKEKLVEEPEFPKEITLSDKEAEGIINLLDLVSSVDGCNNGKNLQSNKEIGNQFAESFLLWSIWRDVPFVHGKVAEMSPMGWEVPEEDVKAYLQNSIHRADLSDSALLQLSGGMVTIQGVTPTAAYYQECMALEKVLQVSESEVSVAGEMRFASEVLDAPYAVRFAVLLEKNRDSLWAGYTLKEIKTWDVMEEQAAHIQKASISVGALDTSKESLANRAEISASSVLLEKGYNHSVQNLIDQDPATCWAEGDAGDGEREFITFSFQEEEDVSGLSILPGYLKSKSYYEKNGKPLSIRITCGTNVWNVNLMQEFIPNFDDPMQGILQIDFGKQIRTKNCNVTIVDAQTGGKYQDLCISEMDVYREK